MVRLASALLACSSFAVAQYDLIISGGKVYDGAGNAWFYGDLGITGDTITAIGKLDRAAAKERLDAKGLAVAPGFIDIHSHSRTAIFAVPSAENVVRQGVTTIVEGNDGGSPVPLKPFLDKIAATSIGVNFATFVGQGSIRSTVMGLVNRPATPEELASMRRLTREAMRDGAFGLSTGLFYVPGNFTPPDEVLELAREAGSLGGIHISHMRNEAEKVLDAVRETINIGEKGNMPTQVTHHKIIGKSNWGLSRETVRLIEEARARGVDVSIDQYPYTASSTGIAALFPQWSLEGGQKALVKRLGAPETKARITAEIVKRIMEDRGGGDPKNVVIASCSFDPSAAGKSLAALAKASGKEPTAENAAEVAIGLQSRGGCSAIYHAIDEEDVERILRYPQTMIASDGGVVRYGEGVPHPRNYGTFPRVLGRYVRERNVLTLENALRRMTSLPAARLGLRDRGILRSGMKADIVVFDPAAVTDKATFERPHQYAEGFYHVIVNGRPVLAKGKMTDNLSGRVLYGPAAEKLRD